MYQSTSIVISLCEIENTEEHVRVRRLNESAVTSEAETKLVITFDNNKTAAVAVAVVHIHRQSV